MNAALSQEGLVRGADATSERCWAAALADGAGGEGTSAVHGRIVAYRTAHASGQDMSGAGSVTVLCGRRDTWRSCALKKAAYEKTRDIEPDDTDDCVTGRLSRAQERWRTA